jgi:voltage-gated potassium channel Kch
MTSVRGPKLVERRVSRFLQEPVSIRNAVSVIVTGTAVVVGISAVLMRVFDRSEFAHTGRALWWAVQTVTTVGYGDVTPKHASGRIIATLVMLYGVAFLAILTAAITSTFVARAARERLDPDAAGGESPEERVEARFDDLVERLDRVEMMLARLEDR